MSTALLIYFLKTNLILIAVAAVYYSAFYKINLPQVKRWFLLTSSLIAFVVPAISFTSPVDGALANIFLPEVVVGTTAQVESSLTLSNLLIPVYFLVTLSLLLRSMWALLKLGKLKSESDLIIVDNLAINVNPNLNHTFSFGNSIFTPSLSIQDDVLAHEKLHIELHHTSDKAFFCLLKALLWFNPAVYLLSRWSSDNHEFEVDQLLVNRGISESEYSRTLIGQALNGSGIQLTNSFSQLQILKTRIHMMKTKAPQGAAWRSAIAIPAILIAVLTAQACDKTQVNDSRSAAGTPVPAVTEEKGVDQPAQFPGGPEEMMKYLAGNIKYPESAVKSKTEGTVYISFLVESDGKVTGAKIMRGVNTELDTEAMRVVTAMPEWTPAYKNRQAVASEYTLPIKFKL